MLQCGLTTPLLNTLAEHTHVYLVTTHDNEFECVEGYPCLEVDEPSSWRVRRIRDNCRPWTAFIT